MIKLLGIRYTGDKVSGVRIEILGSRKQIVLSTECRDYYFMGSDTTNEAAFRYYGGLENAGIAMILDDNKKKPEPDPAPNDEEPDAPEDTSNEIDDNEESPSEDDADTDEVDEEPESDSETDESDAESESDEDDAELSTKDVEVDTNDISDDEVTEYLDTQVEDIEAFCAELGVKLKSRKRETQINELVKLYKNEVVVKMIEATKE